MANAQIASGQYAEAKALYNECLGIYEKTGSPIGQGQSLHSLSLIAFRQGEMDEAARHSRESYAIYDEYGILIGKVKSMNNLGDVARSRGAPAEAEKIYQAALALSDEHGSPSVGHVRASYGLGMVLVEAGSAPRARESYYLVLSQCLERHWVPNFLDTVPGIARWLLAMGYREQAVSALSHALENPVTEAHARHEAEEVLSSITESVAAAALAKPLALGRKMSLDELGAVLMELLS